MILIKRSHPIFPVLSFVRSSKLAEPSSVVTQLCGRPAVVAFHGLMNIQILAAEADTCTLTSVGGIFVESHISPSFMGSSRDVSATNCGPYSHFSPRVFPIAVLLTCNG